LSLLTLGPLTNLALALRLGSAGGPPLPACLARLVVMGGAYQSYGNVSPSAEFNVLEDPEAAAIALATDWAPATLDLVTWEVTQSCGLFPPALQAWLNPQTPTPRASFLARISQHLLTQSQAFSPTRYTARGFFIPDPLAACVAVDALGVVAESVQRGVLVETSGRWARGTTLVDWHGKHKGEAPACVRIIQAVHRKAVEALLVASTAQ
jgi:purine nucleosidase